MPMLAKEEGWISIVITTAAVAGCRGERSLTGRERLALTWAKAVATAVMIAVGTLDRLSEI